MRCSSSTRSSTGPRERCTARGTPPSSDFRRIIDLIEAGRIDTGPWITHRTGFDDLTGVFPTFTRPETGVIKAVVDVG